MVEKPGQGTPVSVAHTISHCLHNTQLHGRNPLYFKKRRSQGDIFVFPRDVLDVLCRRNNCTGIQVCPVAGKE